MSVETEVERLVVRLMGDGSDYKRMLEMAQAETKNVAAQVEASSKKIEDIGKSVQSFSGGILSALSAFGVVGSLQGAFNKFAEMETGQIRLRATIEGSGRAVDAVIEDYNRFADSVSRTTLLTGGQTLAMVQQAEALGLQGEAAQRAVQNSIGLAGALGGEAQGYISTAVAMEHGNVTLLQRMLRLQHGTSESEVFAEANRVIERGLRIQTAEMNSSSGQIVKLQKSFSSLSREIGGLVAQVLNPLLTQLRAGIDWFNSLDSTVKGVTLTIITLLLAIKAYPVALGLVQAVLGNVATAMQLVKAAASVMFGPWGPVILIVVALVLMLIEEIGGIKNAWQAVQEVVKIFAAWVQPILQGLWDFIKAGWEELLPVILAWWEAIKTQIAQVGGFIVGVWQSIFGEGELNWSEIRDTIVNALLTCEFSVKHFEQIVELVGTHIALEFQKFVDTVAYLIRNLLVIVEWFGRNWQAIFVDLFNLSATMLGNFAGNVVRIFTNLPGLITGSVSWDQVWTPLTQGFESAIEEIPPLTNDLVSETQRQLERMAQDQGAALAAAQDDFNAQRRQQMGRQTNQAERDGAKIGENLNKGLTKELQKFDAALSGSAEALSRIASFQATGGEGRGGQSGLGSSAARTPTGNPMTNMFRGMSGTFEAARTAGLNMFGNMGSLATDIWNNIQTEALRFWNGLPGMASSAITTITNWAVTFWTETLPGWADTFFNTTLPEWNNTFWNETLPDWADTFFNDTMPGWADTFFNETLPGWAETLFTTTIPDWAETLFTETIPNWAETLFTETIPNWAQTFFTETLPNWATTLFSTTIPNLVSTLFSVRMPQWAETFFTTTLPDMAETAWNNIVQMVRRVIEGLNPLNNVPNVGEAASNAVSSITGGNINLGSTNNLLGQAVGFLGDMVQGGGNVVFGTLGL